MAAANRIQFG